MNDEIEGALLPRRVADLKRAIEATCNTPQKDGKLWSTDPTSDTGDSTKMALTEAETRKRTLVETTGADDDDPAEKYWRTEHLVGKV